MLDFTARMLGSFSGEKPQGAAGLGPAEGHVAAPSVGMVAGTRVATAFGWRPVEAVMAGDHVLTFDSGMQEVVAVERYSVPSSCPMSLWPLSVPAGALGNRSDMTILAEQPVLLEADYLEVLFDDPFALVPAVSLVGYRGITRVSPDLVGSVIGIHFREDQVVFAEFGALFFCARHKSAGLEDLLNGQIDGAYGLLPLDIARDIVSLIATEEAGAAAAA